MQSTKTDYIAGLPHRVRTDVAAVGSRVVTRKQHFPDVLKVVETLDLAAVKFKKSGLTASSPMF